MAKTKTTKLLAPNGVTVHVASEKVDARLAAGFTKPSGKSS